MEIINNRDDSTHGCRYTQVKVDYLPDKIRICLVNIDSLQIIAKKISTLILDHSWIISLDPTAQLAYEGTVEKTSDIINDICKKIIDNPKIERDFGEIMVSITASESLRHLFNHISLPISELWKEKVRGNPGFDFHTVCQEDLIHFGEAKYSSSKNPYEAAINQANDFISNKKHYIDIVHLEKIIQKKEPIENLVNNYYSIVAAFSINSDNHQRIIEHAIERISNLDIYTKARNIYLIGVIC